MIKAIVWDIGGVILTDPLLTDLWEGVEGSKSLRTAFGKGKISVEGFFEEGSKLLGMSKNDFEKKYTEIYCNIHKMNETSKLLSNIRVTQYILSDTNPIHGSYIKTKFTKILNKFKKIFLSYEIGMRKNSEDVFYYIAKEICCNPKEILFIDNKEKIVNYAKNAGYQTFLFSNSSELKSYLVDNDLLV